MDDSQDYMLRPGRLNPDAPTLQEGVFAMNDAKTICNELEGCHGFSFDRSNVVSGTYYMYFKGVSDVYVGGNWTSYLHSERAQRESYEKAAPREFKNQNQ